MHQKAAKEYELDRKSHQQQKIHQLSYQHKSHNADIFAAWPKKQQQCVVFLIALILLQHAEMYLCHHMPTNKRTSQNSDGNRENAHYLRNRAHATGGSNISTTTGGNIGDIINESVGNEVGSRRPTVKKRRIGSGQPEEIFSLDDRIETNYDEYPMVVPKRAALLLDRLMVALHHALEQERGKISDFYAERNDKMKVGNTPGSDEDPEQISANHMYSDDDPSVMMDYDFKDLNSINRATGETLMAKSFQRRGGMSLDLGGDLGNAEGVAMLTAAATADDAGGFGGGGVGVGRNSIGNGGRMYWRCYFNAVSCF